VEVEALRDVNMDVLEGEALVVRGPSGAGKTTLLNIMGGLDKPTEGEVRVLDVTISELEEDVLAAFRSRSIGFVFQSYNLISTLTASENIEFAMELAGSHGAEARDKAMSLLDMVGLEDRADHLPGQLSGGEQQRIAFARALANDPPILLVDEPTANLDEATGREIVGILGKLKDKKKSIIVATHDKDISRLADRVLDMNKGKIGA
jgi:putative ABC transport system ATP-binding protein